MAAAALSAQNRAVVALLLSAYLFLAACSAQQVNISTPLSNAIPDDASMVLVDDVTMKAKRSRATNLKAGTRWSRIGSIEQGDVYNTKDQVVILNSFDVHEAAIVVDGDMIVGYFLKVEETFVEAEPVSVNLIRE